MNNDRLFEPKTEDPLGDLIEILNNPSVKHKKPPELQMTDEIATGQQLIDNDFIDLQTEFNKVKDVATEQKRQQKIEDTVEAVIDQKKSFGNFDNFYWEDDFFNGKDSKETIDTSKDIFNNIRPIDERTFEELIDDGFVSIDNRTPQELENENYIELELPAESDADIESPAESVFDIDLTSA